MPHDPFQNPKPKNDAPWWLKEWDEKIDGQHVKLMQALEKLEKRPVKVTGKRIKNENGI